MKKMIKLWIVWAICMGVNAILYVAGDKEDGFLFLGIAIGLGLTMLLSLPKEIINNTKKTESKQ